MSRCPSGWLSVCPSGLHLYSNGRIGRKGGIMAEQAKANLYKKNFGSLFRFNYFQVGQTNLLINFYYFKENSGRVAHGQRGGGGRG